MQLYLETADAEVVREALAWRILDGVHTTPAMLARMPGDPREVLVELCQLVQGPVSVEVNSTETTDMVDEARSLAALHDRLVVRVPCTPAGIPAIVELAQHRVTVDACLCFSVPQALLAAKAGARLISPAVGPMDDAGGDGLALLSAVITVLDQYEFKAKVVAASAKHPGHVAEAARMGADATTLTLTLLQQLADHPLTQESRRRHQESWRRAQN
jgi:transaldolase